MITDLRELLRPGITGTMRWPGGQLEPLPESAVKRWRAGVFSFSRSVGDWAPAFTPVGPGRQYHAALVHPRSGGNPEPLELLLHVLLPFVGARLPGTDSGPTWAYLDPPGSLQGLDGLSAIASSLLNQPFTRDAWMKALVDPQAWDDMAYHAPDRVGDLVFADMA